MQSLQQSSSAVFSDRPPKHCWRLSRFIIYSLTTSRSQKLIQKAKKKVFKKIERLSLVKKGFFKI